MGFFLGQQTLSIHFYHWSGIHPFLPFLTTSLARASVVVLLGGDRFSDLVDFLVSHWGNNM